MATSATEQAKGKVGEAKESQDSSLLGKARRFLRVLGPGVITGAADDDPSGIVTYAQTGAQFGYAQLWTALFTFPLMTVVQEICARIGLQYGTGLATVLRRHYPRPVLYFCVALLCVANTINLGADLGAMAASANLLVPIPVYAWLVLMTAVVLLLLIVLNYRRYSGILRFLTLSLFTYVVAVFVVHTDWSQALRDTVIPTLKFDKDYLMNLVAILGTTISPYLFFWQTSQEVEEEVSEGRTSESERYGATKTEVRWMRTDVTTGMLFSQVVMWFIVAATAATLFHGGVHQIDSAAKAAQALKPLAGPLAEVLFALGIIGTGALAVPVMSGSIAYAVGDTFRFTEGLSQKWYQAPLFYGAIVLATVVGAGINLLGINPMSALYYSAVLNGLAAPPLLVMLMLVSNNRRIMKGQVNGTLSNVLGWVTTAFMTIAAVSLIYTLITGQ